MSEATRLAYREGWLAGRKDGRAAMRRLIRRRLRAIAAFGRKHSDERSAHLLDAILDQVTAPSREETP